MTVEEALNTWTHCCQCGEPWKGNFVLVENDGLLARKLRGPLAAAELEQVQPAGCWPNARYSALLKVSLGDKHVCYLAVRKEG